MEQILPDDLISRCIVYSKFFSEGVHTNKLLWEFTKSSADGRVHESGVLRRLAPADNDVNRIGCAIAAKQNLERQTEPGASDRRYYCGFRTARFGDFDLVSEDYVIEITNVPEGGETSHVDVALRYLADGKSRRATARTDAGMALAEHFGEAVAHRCACDAGDQFHPFDRFGDQCLNAGLNDNWAQNDVIVESDLPAGEKSELTA